MSQFQNDHAAYDQRHPEVAGQRGRVTVVKYADQECARRADPGPHRVGGPDGDVTLREPEHESAQAHEDDGAREPEQTGLRVLRHLQADGPADLKKPGDK